MDSVMADVLLDNLDFLERVERMQTVVETRRNAILREIDRRRASAAES
jgi:hypothetical protein